MAQKPYKHNIEYIEQYYSYGSEAKVVEFKPAHQEKKVQVPKQEKEPVTTLCIDPIAFCGLMVAVVMLVVMIAGVIHFNVICQDHAIMENYVNQLREENVLLSHQYHAGYNLEQVGITARTLGMIPVEEAQTISIQVQVPVRQPEPGFLDNIVWFLGGLFE
ncbi:MAG: hypothetical protein E7465_10350 [Ruminococcaceae bacterium]|nr:hypothetical protein [Oscillospiraceae bacterium]